MGEKLKLSVMDFVKNDTLCARIARMSVDGICVIAAVRMKNFEPTVPNLSIDNKSSVSPVLNMLFYSDSQFFPPLAIILRKETGMPRQQY